MTSTCDRGPELVAECERPKRCLAVGRGTLRAFASPRKDKPVKKLLLLLVVVALGAVIAKKVRAA